MSVSRRIDRPSSKRVPTLRSTGCLAALWCWALIGGTGVLAQTVPLPSRVTGGLGRGVTIATENDEFTVNVRARIQARRAAGDSLDDSEPSTSEMQIRRMRLLFQGNALGPGLTYYIQFGFSNLDTEPDLRLPLRDAYVTWAPRA